MRVIFVGFVPDEGDDFSRLYDNLKDNWEIETAKNGQQAQASLEKSPADLVVCEMSLPDMTGPDFMKTIAERYPGTIRFIMSDKLQKEVIPDSLGHVHQFIPRPCDPNGFKTRFDHASNLRQLLSNKELCEKIATIDSLPGPPEIYEKITAELKSETCSIRNLSDLISRDINITLRLIKTVNSAFYGVKQHIENVSQAISLLGLDTVQNIVFATGVFSQFEDPGISGYSLEDIHSRSMIVGARAELIAELLGMSKSLSADARLSGMLHDIGKLIVLSNFLDEFTESRKYSEKENIPLYEAEREILGVSDAEIGAYLLSLWGMPNSIVEPVAFHCEPDRATNPTLNSLTAVHLAYAIDRDERHNIRDEKLSAVNHQYLAGLGLTDHLQNIRNVCPGVLV
jgi:HD-like signal output (HDOD) protein